MAVSISERGKIHPSRDRSLHPQVRLDVASDTERREGLENNSFIAFINQHADAFDRLSGLSGELQDEERGWRRSPSVPALIEDGYERLQGFSPAASEQRKRRAIGEFVQHALRYPQKDALDYLQERFNVRASELRRHATYQQSQAARQWMDRLMGFCTDFQEARKPIVESLHEVRRELFSAFSEHISQGYGFVADFQRFFLDKDLEPYREYARSFLVALADQETSAKNQRTESLLNRAQQEGVERYRNAPDAAMINAFTGNIMAGESGLQLKQWILFGIAVAGRAEPELRASLNIDSLPMDVLTRLFPDYVVWPDSMKRDYERWVVTEYACLMTSIKRHLEPFKTPERKTDPITIFEDAVKGKKKEKQQAPARADAEEEAVVVPEREKRVYPIGVIQRIKRGLTVRELSEDSLQGFIARQARRFTRDPIMIDDLKTLIESLRQDPYGEGTRKLINEFITVEQRRIPRRRLSPRDRPGVALQHPNTHTLRIVFAIHKMGENREPIIILEQVITHEVEEKSAFRKP